MLGSFPVSPGFEYVGGFKGGIPEMEGCLKEEKVTLTLCKSLKEIVLNILNEEDRSAGRVDLNPKNLAVFKLDSQPGRLQPLVEKIQSLFLQYVEQFRSKEKPGIPLTEVDFSADDLECFCQKVTEEFRI